MSMLFFIIFAELIKKNKISTKYLNNKHTSFFRKINRTKFNLIFGAVVLALIYLATCFDGGIHSFGFKLYPYDLISNKGHYSSALAGLILGLTIQISRLSASKAAQKQ